MPHERALDTPAPSQPPVHNERVYTVHTALLTDEFSPCTMLLTDDVRSRLSLSLPDEPPSQRLARVGRRVRVR